MFLVLANRARSIRRKESVASWLFGVGVAARARSRVARRRAIDHKAAERVPECYVLPEHDPDREIVHEELDRLPDRLRAPVVLCYLEGLTYDAAAHQLDLTEGTLRGRLSQARKRLRGRLTRRGVAVPAGLLTAGATIRACGGSRSAGPLHHSDRARIDRGQRPRSSRTGSHEIHASVPAQDRCGRVVAGRSNLRLGRSGLGPGAPPACRGACAGTTSAADPATKSADDEKVSSQPIRARGVVVDETGRPVAGALVLAYAYTDREARSLTAANGSFTVLVSGRQLSLRGTPSCFQDDRRACGSLPLRLKCNRRTDHPAGSYRREANPRSSGSSHRFEQCPGRVCLGSSRRCSVRLRRRPDPRRWLRMARVPVDAKVEWIFALKSGRGFDYAEFGPIDQAAGQPEEYPEMHLAVPESDFGRRRTVRVKAVDREGTPLAGVAFAPWLLRKDGRRSDVNVSTRLSIVSTDSDGIATFDWLPPSKEALIFWPLSESFASRRVQGTDSERDIITARLTRNELIRGHVTYADGQPASGIEVQAYGSGSGIDHGQAQARTAQDGSYEMPVSPGEAYAVFVDNKDWAAPTRSTWLFARESPPSKSTSSSAMGQ